MKKVLLIESDADIVEMMTRQGRKVDLEVFGVTSLDLAKKVVEEQLDRFDVVLLDDGNCFPGLCYETQALVRLIVAQGYDRPIVVMPRCSESRDFFMGAGCTHFCEKYGAIDYVSQIQTVGEAI